jgi:hypothetical protein
MVGACCLAHCEKQKKNDRARAYGIACHFGN